MSDEHIDHYHRNDSHFWIGLFLGGLIGALLIVLMGTEKGRKIAKKLQEEGLDFWEEKKDEFTDKKEEVTRQVEKQVERIEEKGAELIEKGRELIEEGKHIEKQVVAQVVETKAELANQAIAQADSALAHIEQLQERGRVTTAELRKRLFKNIPKKT